MAEPKLTDPSAVNIDALIKGAQGEKPATMQEPFGNEMLTRVSDLIAGKKEALHKDMFGDQPISNDDVDDEALLADPTEDEVETALSDDESDEEMDAIVDELDDDEQPEESEEPEVEEQPEPEAEPEEPEEPEQGVEENDEET
jgi:hypothetical protein